MSIKIEEMYRLPMENGDSMDVFYKRSDGRGELQLNCVVFYSPANFDKIKSKIETAIRAKLNKRAIYGQIKLVVYSKKVSATNWREIAAKFPEHIVVVPDYISVHTTWRTLLPQNLYSSNLSYMETVRDRSVNSVLMGLGT